MTITKKIIRLLIIILILTLVYFLSDLIAKQFQQSIVLPSTDIIQSEEKQEEEEPVDNRPFKWQVELDKYSHEIALKKFAKSRGYSYEKSENGSKHLYIRRKGKCKNKFDYNKAFKENDFSEFEKPYLEFIDGYCMEDKYKSYANFRYLCEGGTKDVFKKQFPDVGGTYKMFYKGNGKCEINPKHCADKGVSYVNGDCKAESTQKFFESVIGTTAIRSSKEAIRSPEAIAAAAATTAVVTALVAAGPLGWGVGGFIVGASALGSLMGFGSLF